MAATLGNDTGPDDANHAPEGLYLLAGDGIESGAAEERDLRGIAPTLLSLLGEQVPGEMEGRSIVDEPSRLAARGRRRG